MQDIRNENLPFCVQRNAANDAYFTFHPKFGNAIEGDDQTAALNILRRDSVYAWQRLHTPFPSGSLGPFSWMPGLPPPTAPLP